MRLKHLFHDMMEEQMKRVLILGGTRDAAQLAAQISALPGVEVITSLAGRIRQLRDFRKIR